MYSAVVPPWAEITSRRFGSPATSQHQVKDNMFAQNQIVGVNGDFGSLEPEITIFTSVENPEALKGITTFSGEEGMKIEIQTFRK